MDDNCFDRSLSEELDGLPPSDDTAAAVTPWGCALDRITAGLVLTSFTLHFLWLQFLLPAVGGAPALPGLPHSADRQPLVPGVLDFQHL
jgi:hypothetical protein